MKSNTKLLSCLAGALLVMFGQNGRLTTTVQAGEKVTLHVAYTSDSNGYIDPCG